MGFILNLLSFESDRIPGGKRDLSTPSLRKCAKPPEAHCHMFNSLSCHGRSENVPITLSNRSVIGQGGTLPLTGSIFTSLKVSIVPPLFLCHCCWLDLRSTRVYSKVTAGCCDPFIRVELQKTWHLIKFDPFWFHRFANEREWSPPLHLVPISPSLLSPCPSQKDTQPSVNVSTVCHKWIINGDTLKSRFPCHKMVCLSNIVPVGSERVEREPLPRGKEVQKRLLLPVTLCNNLSFIPKLVLVFWQGIFVLGKWQSLKKSRTNSALCLAQSCEWRAHRGSWWPPQIWLEITELLRCDRCHQMTGFDFTLLRGATRWRQRNTNEQWDEEQEHTAGRGGVVNSCVLKVV